MHKKDFFLFQSPCAKFFLLKRPLQVMVLVFFMGLMGYAQSDFRRDSLHEVLNGIDDPIKKAKMLYELGVEAMGADVDEALKYFNECLEIAKELEDDKWAKKANRQLGKCYLQKGDIPVAKQSYNEFLKYSLDVRPIDYLQLASEYHEIGKDFRGLGFYKEAINYFKKTLEVRLQVNDREGEVGALLDISSMYQSLREIDSVEVTLQKAHKKALGIGDSILLARVNNSFGLTHEVKGEYDVALQYYRKSAGYAVNEAFELGRCYANMGNVYYFKGGIDSTIFYYNKGIACFESSGAERELAMLSLNLGSVLGDEGFVDEAIEMYNKSLEVFNKLGNIDFQAATYLNIGVTYLSQNKIQIAEQNLKEALQLAIRTDNPARIATVYVNMADIAERQKKYDLAISHSKKALEMFSKIGEQYSIARVNLRLGKLYLSKKRYDLASSYIKQSIAFAESAEALELKKKSYMFMIEASLLNNGNRQGLTYFEKYIEASDSLGSRKNHEVVQELLTKYELLEKTDSIKAQQAELQRQEALNAKNQEISKYKTVQLTMSLIGLVVVAILGLFSFVNYRRKQLANRRLTVKNEIIAQKNKEILDSINYAKRIQEAILPPHRLVKSYFTESFILYQPKDIVAGDFYWFESSGDEIYFAVADCTGHGVPGAMVSVVCANALRKAVNGLHIKEPSEILDKTNELVIEMFQRSDDGVQDGMDISFCKLNTKTLELTFAGAYNSLYRVTSIDEQHNNRFIVSGQYQLIEYKADKQPIGHYEFAKPFKQQTIQLKPGDTLYIFTDGYADQFGGKANRKYKYGPFKKLLLQNHKESMIDQKSLLLDEFNSWKGKTFQVDDICVIGVKV